MKQQNLSIALLVITALAACSATKTPETTLIASTAAKTQEPASTLPATATSTATRRPTPTQTLTPPATPTDKPILPMPSPNEWTIGLDFLFDESISPEGCKLPCWMGLVPGSSTKDEVKEAYSDVFGFENPPGFFAYSDEWYGVPTITQNYYVWGLEPHFRQFGTSAWINDNTGVLEAVSLSWVSADINSYLPPAKVLRQLDEPSDIRVSISGTAESITEGSLDMVIIYHQGMVFSYYTHIPLIVVTDADGTETRIANVCFEGADWTETTDIILSSTVYLTQPIADDDFRLSPLHDYIFNQEFMIQEMKPLTVVANMDMKSITSQVITGNCIEVDLADVNP
jgi:hypothetical protein